MATTDRTRADLHHRLDEVLGTKDADTLMSHLPPVTWQHVVTKDDLRSSTAELQSEMRSLSTELRSEMRVTAAELRVEMHQGFTRTIQWLAGVMAAWSAVTIAAVGILT